MESVFSIEIRQAMYCGVEFYSLYIDGVLWRNYDTFKQAKKGMFKMLEPLK
jgi:hypothetical protein